MWSSMPIPVATADRPEPSSATRQRTSVSAVRRSAVPIRVAAGGSALSPLAPSAARSASSSAGVAGLTRIWVASSGSAKVRTTRPCSSSRFETGAAASPRSTRRKFAHESWTASPAERSAVAMRSRSATVAAARACISPASRIAIPARATENDEIDAGGRIASSRRAISGGARM